MKKLLIAGTVFLSSINISNTCYSAAAAGAMVEGGGGGAAAAEFIEYNGYFSVNGEQTLGGIIWGVLGSTDKDVINNAAEAVNAGLRKGNRLEAQKAELIADGKDTAEIDAEIKKNKDTLERNHKIFSEALELLRKNMSGEEAPSTALALTGPGADEAAKAHADGDPMAMFAMVVFEE